MAWKWSVLLVLSVGLSFQQLLPKNYWSFKPIFFQSITLSQKSEINLDIQSERRDNRVEGKISAVTEASCLVNSESLADRCFVVAEV